MKKRIRITVILKFLLILFILSLTFLIKACFAEFTPDIVIIGAMDSEVNNLIKASKSHKKELKQFEVAKGKIGKNRILITKSGVGKVNSAMTTQYLIDKYSPKLIINTGLAGAVDNDLKIGDIVIASDLIQHDFDGRDVFITNKKINGVFRETILNKYLDLKVIQERIATGDKFIADYAVKKSINRKFKAKAVDMESGSVAQVAQNNKIPCVVVRTISDLANDSFEDEVIKSYEKIEYDIASRSADVLVYILRNVDLKKVL